MSASGFIVRVSFVLAVWVGFVILQIFLSKRESKWPGLILPILCFLFSFLSPMFMVMPPEGTTGNYVLEMVVAFLLGNIPTAILLIIYLVCRGKQQRRKQSEKMNTQNLQ